MIWTLFGREYWGGCLLRSGVLESHLVLERSLRNELRLHCVVAFTLAVEAVRGAAASRCAGGVIRDGLDGEDLVQAVLILWLAVGNGDPVPPDAFFDVGVHAIPPVIRGTKTSEGVHVHVIVGRLSVEPDGRGVVLDGEGLVGLLEQYGTLIHRHERCKMSPKGVLDWRC